MVPHLKPVRQPSGIDVWESELYVFLFGDRDSRHDGGFHHENNRSAASTAPSTGLVATLGALIATLTRSSWMGLLVGMGGFGGGVLRGA